MTTTVLAPYLKQRFVTNDGLPAVGGTVTTYAAGTTNPIATYKDSIGTVNANPITLNSRGECDIWLLPNVAYKFVVADGNGNAIWTEDNVVQSQLITLYGGVDTGSANAYVLNFTASFTSYTDGIVIYWIPSNTNTSASTININGLGVINLVNGDGSTFQAGEITANIPVQILIKGGQAILLNPYSVNSSGIFTGTLLGCTTSPTQAFLWRRSGNIVSIFWNSGSFTATSNTTGLGISGLPSTLAPLVPQFVLLNGLVIDNGNPNSGAVRIAGTAITFTQAVVSGSTLTYTGSFTASGSKGLQTGGNFSYIVT